MFRRVFLARLLLAALFGALLVPAQAQEKFSEPALSDPDSWTVVLLPDLQGYAKKACNQPIMEIMTSWIAAHAEALNTKLVLCVGDLVEQNDRISNGYSGDQSSHKQWEATARAFSQLDGVVPYMTATGNHDYTYTRPTYNVQRALVTKLYASILWANTYHRTYRLLLPLNNLHLSSASTQKYNEIAAIYR